VFLELFYGLRDEGVPTGLQEWMMLMEALEKGLHDASFLRFYHLARATLVKSEAYFDAFDRVFARVFEGLEGELSIRDEILAWMKDPKAFEGLTEEQRKALEMLDAEELMRRLLETMQKQDERHDGGNRWVGTGGSSPFGQGGHHPTGIRVGQGGQRSAMKVAEDRHFAEYRTDGVLDLRSTKMAIKRLRQLTRSGEDVLDLPETVDETCRNGGEIDLVFRPERRNNVRLLLFMDVGGTMEPYYEPVSRLLTALHEERGLRAFQPYYFHNCIYERVSRTSRMYGPDTLPTAEVLRTYDHRWKVMIVGDAAMHPSELTSPRGNIDPRLESATRGIDWLHRIDRHYDRVVWVNPDSPRIWDRTRTTRIVQGLFPMYHLSVDGLEGAVRALVGSRSAEALPH